MSLRALTEAAGANSPNTTNNQAFAVAVTPTPDSQLLRVLASNHRKILYFSPGVWSSIPSVSPQGLIQVALMTPVTQSGGCLP